jgi:hypothetical protein
VNKCQSKPCHSNCNVKLRIYAILPSLGERDVVNIDIAAMLERNINATGPLIEPYMDTLKSMLTFPSFSSYLMS